MGATSAGPQGLIGPPLGLHGRPKMQTNQYLLLPELSSGEVVTVHFLLRGRLSQICKLTIDGFIFFRPTFLHLKMKTNEHVMSKIVNKKIPTERIQKLSERIVVQQYSK